MRNLFRMLRLVRPYPGRLAWLFVVGLFYSAFHNSFIGLVNLFFHLLEPAPEGAAWSANLPGWLPDAVAGFLGGLSRSEALGCVILVFGSVLLGGKCATMYLQRYLRSWLSRRVVIDTQARVAGHLLSLDLGFFQRGRSGELVSRMTNDMRMLSQTVSLFGDILTLPLTLAGGVIGAFILNWQLALLSLLVAPVGFVVVAQLSRKMRRAAKRAFEHLGTATDAMVQFLAGIRTVKSFCREEHEYDRFHRILRDLFNVGMKGARARARVRPIVEFVAGVSGMAVLFIGGRWVLLEKMPLADLMAFYTALGLMFQPAKELSNANSEAQETLPAAERVFEVLDQQCEVREAADAGLLPLFAREIRFEDVTFSYVPGQPVLRNIDLVVPAGKTVALVGPSGAGKSTLADLVARFHDPQEGRILVDGHDIRTVRIRSLLEQIAIVSQEAFLFHDTLRANIAYGRSGATEEEIVQAARAARIHDEICAFPRGYDTLAGDRGGSLSGGQRQRVCIARAILKNAPILILDEATSALDTENERLVQEALERLMESRTSLVIAHRLSTIRHADRVVVLEDGRITARGTHDELIRQTGTYAMLWTLQTGAPPGEGAAP